MYLGCLRNLGNVSNQVTKPVFIYSIRIFEFVYIHCMRVISQLLTIYYIFITCGHPNRIWWPISWPRLCWPCLSASIRCLDVPMEIDAVGGMKGYGAGRISSWVGYVRTTKNGHSWARQASTMIMNWMTHKKETACSCIFLKKADTYSSLLEHISWN